MQRTGLIFCLVEEFQPSFSLRSVEEINCFLSVGFYIKNRTNCSFNGKFRLIFVSCQGAWGGSLLMSRRHRWKLDGVERQVMDWTWRAESEAVELFGSNNNHVCSCHLQGQFSDMEPAQDDVSSSAVLSAAGQRGGGPFIWSPVNIMMMINCFGWNVQV